MMLIVLTITETEDNTVLNRAMTKDIDSNFACLISLLEFVWSGNDIVWRIRLIEGV